MLFLGFKLGVDDGWDGGQQTLVHRVIQAPTSFKRTRLRFDHSSSMKASMTKDA